MAFLDSESRLHTQIEVSEASESREEWPPGLRSEKKKKTKNNRDPWAEVWSLKLIVVSVYTDRRQLFKGEIWSTFSSAKNNDQREALCYFFWDSAAEEPCRVVGLSGRGAAPSQGLQGPLLTHGPELWCRASPQGCPGILKASEDSVDFQNVPSKWAGRVKETNPNVQC